MQILALYPTQTLLLIPTVPSYSHLRWDLHESIEEGSQAWPVTLTHLQMIRRIYSRTLRRTQMTKVNMNGAWLTGWGCGVMMPSCNICTTLRVFGETKFSVGRVCNHLVWLLVVTFRSYFQTTRTMHSGSLKHISWLISTLVQNDCSLDRFRHHLQNAQHLLLHYQTVSFFQPKERVGNMMHRN